jgi:hypothetical protein
MGQYVQTDVKSQLIDLKTGALSNMIKSKSPWRQSVSCQLIADHLTFTRQQITIQPCFQYGTMGDFNS